MLLWWHECTPWLWCPQCIRQVGNNDDDSGVYDWFARKQATRGKRIANVANSPPNKHAAFTKPIADSPGSWAQEEPDVLDVDVVDVLWGYLTSFTCEFIRDATKHEIAENWVDVSKADVKDIAGLYELGCFE